MQEREFYRGQQIAYVPLHADGDIGHPDVEFGFVTSVRHFEDGRESTVFCRYWSKYNGETLRTKANSEGAPIRFVVPHDSRQRSEVEAMLKAHCEV